MKTLFLLRHSKSSWDEPDKEDFERPLNKRGIKDAPLMGKLIAGMEVPPAKVFSSGALRAKMTAEAIAAELGINTPVDLVEEFYQNDVFGMLEFIKKIPDELESVLLIEHNPTWEELASVLVCGSAALFKFPTSALAILTSEIGKWELAGKESFALDALVHPRILKGLGKGKTRE